VRTSYAKREGVRIPRELSIAPGGSIICDRREPQKSPQESRAKRGFQKDLIFEIGKQFSRDSLTDFQKFNSGTGNCLCSYRATTIAGHKIELQRLPLKSFPSENLTRPPVSLPWRDSGIVPAMLIPKLRS